jgi:hypothetical protein
LTNDPTHPSRLHHSGSQDGQFVAAHRAVRLAVSNGAADGSQLSARGNPPAKMRTGGVYAFRFDLTGKYFETATGRPGLVIRIIRFKEIIPGTFDVLVGFSNLPPGHDRFTCRISNLAGEWVIKSRKPA